jgi:prepilin-type processing-associated H-X9-DG protein
MDLFQIGEDFVMISNGKRGFSRTELVVVCLCVTLVGVILLPSLSTARDAGKRAVCLANLKTLGAAALLYARDHNDKIPAVGIEFDEIGTEQGDPKADWITKTTDSLSKAFEYGYVWEYVQTYSAFLCPVFKNEINPKPRIGYMHGPYVWGWPDGEGTQNPPGPIWSYSLNGQAAYSMNDSQWRANPELVLPSPISVMMLFEQDYNDMYAFDNSISLFSSTYGMSNGEDSIGRYHKVSGTIENIGGTILDTRRGSGNIFFFDGHIGELSMYDYIMQRSTVTGTLELCGGYVGFTWPGF